MISTAAKIMVTITLVLCLWALVLNDLSSVEEQAVPPRTIGQACTETTVKVGTDFVAMRWVSLDGDLCAVLWNDDLQHTKGPGAAYYAVRIYNPAKNAWFDNLEDARHFLVSQPYN